MKIDIITDLQFGSTGKGLLAGLLASTNNPDTIVTAWAPNAGHTFISAEHGKMVVTALPNGMISQNLKRIMLGPGSVINVDNLHDEIKRYTKCLEGVEIVLHANAAVVTPEHRQAESAYAFQIGSTMKGVGEATVQKIRRNPLNDNTAWSWREFGPLAELGVTVVGTNTWLNMLDEAKVMQIEGAQGYSLGINSGMYPYTTSRECTTAQLISDCLIPYRMLQKNRGRTSIWGVCRTYPIRVSNRFSPDGKMIGTSGPCYEDQKEISWRDVGLEPELTTVTKLPRRIFTWSSQQIRQAVAANGCNRAFLNFCNYDQTANADTGNDRVGMINDLSDAGVHPPILTGWGPAMEDIIS